VIDACFSGDYEISVKNGNIQLVNIVGFEDYLSCVTVSEMSAEAPKEYIKAQAIVARSWAACLLYDKHPDSDFDVCNDDDCQRYQGVTYSTSDSILACIECTGVYLLDANQNVVPGYYSKCCGGVSEQPEDCFGFSSMGLKSVVDGDLCLTPDNFERWMSLSEEESRQLNCGSNGINTNKYLGKVDETRDYFRWKHSESKSSLAQYLNDKADIENASLVNELVPLTRGRSGRIHQLKIIYSTKNGTTRNLVVQNQYEIRRLLHSSFLYSSAFSVEKIDDSFIFTGSGWGHGVGLCQIGACNLALQGKSAEDILKIYFPDATPEKCY